METNLDNIHITFCMCIKVYLQDCKQSHYLQKSEEVTAIREGHGNSLIVTHCNDK